MAGTAPWLQRTGLVLLPLSLLGSATLLTDALFPLLALSTLGYELWVGAVAWHWLRSERPSAAAPVTSTRARTRTPRRRSESAPRAW